VNSNDQFARTSTDRLLDLEPPKDSTKISILETPFKVNGHPILFGRRFNGNLVCLFPTSDGDTLPEKSLPLTNGFEVSSFSPIMSAANQSSWYIEFANISNVDVILFGAILDEVIRVIQDDSSIISIIKEVVERWRTLLSLDVPNGLSVNKVIGLLGELSILQFLLENEMILTTSEWVGPHGARHDFEFAFKSIEIKTTIRKRSNEVSIHGFNQLTAFAGKRVQIIHVRIEPDPHGISLPALVSQIQLLLGNQRGDFDEKLLRVGYRDSHKHLYEDVRVQFIEYQDIAVNGDFPSISRDSLSAIDPKRLIQNIEYVVDVTGLATQTSASLSQFDWSWIK